MDRFLDAPYGLPIDRYLNSPYGLAPTPAPAMLPRQPLPVPVLPPPMPPRRPVAWEPAPEPSSQPPAWLVRPESNQPMVQSGKPTGIIVGKDIPLDKLIEIQRMAESTNNYQAINREKKGNTASGAYQYTDGTWNNYAGYPKALLAPKEVQDRRFAEDIQNRVRKYNGDMFKSLAAHYLPAFANKPESWRKPATFKVNGKTVTTKSVESYLRQVLKDSPYINQLDAYLEQNG